jgi:hypothetical protein
MHEHPFARYWHLRRQGLGPTQSLFAPALSVRATSSGFDSITRQIDIAGTVITPSLLFLGASASGTGWTATVGSNLALEAGTAPSYAQGTPSVGQSVLFNNGGYYKSAATTLGQVTTEDMILGVCWRTSGSDLTIAAKRNAGVGWSLHEASSKITLLIQDADGAASVASAALTAGCWHYAEFYIDRSGSGQCYINGVASGDPVDVSAVEKTLTNSEHFAVGGTSAGGALYTSHVAGLSLYIAAGFLDTHLQTTLAKRRFMQLVDLYATSAIGERTPTFTRATAAMVDVESATSVSYYYVSAGWPRIAGRLDSGAVGRTGYLSEVAATNIATKSNDANSWDNRANVTSAADAVASPMQSIAIDSIIESTDAGAETHRVSSPSISYTNGLSYVISFVVKKGARNWLHVSTNAGAITAYIDLATPAFGTVSAAVTTKYIKALGDDFLRVILVATAGSTASGSCAFFPTTENGSVTYQGNGSTAFYLGAFQVEVNQTGYPTSIILTGDAAVTRNADVLTYDSSNIPSAGDAGQGAMSASVLMPAYTAAVQDKTIACVNDGGAVTDSIDVVVNTDGGLSARTQADGGTSGDANGSTSIMTNALVTATGRWKKNLVTISRGTTIDATETSADVPDDLDRVVVGAGAGGAKQLCGLVSNFKLHRHFHGGR